MTPCLPSRTPSARPSATRSSAAPGQACSRAEAATIPSCSGAARRTGDTVVDFAGNGAFRGDMLQFVGYGPGATFVQIDATHWQVNSGDGLVHETIAFQNGAPVHMSDVLFA